jgi:hypothetical protein
MEEEVPMVAPEEAVEMPTEADPNEEVKAALEKAGMALLKKLFAKEIELPVFNKKLKDLIGMKEKATADEEATPAAVQPAPAEATESIKAENRKLKAEATARELLESEGIRCKPARVSALARCATETERHQLLSEFPRDAGHIVEPRSASPLREGANVDGWKAPKDKDEFKHRLVG